MCSDVGLSIMSRDTLSLKNSRRALKFLPSSARDETNEKRKCAIKVTQTKLSSEKFHSINACALCRCDQKYNFGVSLACFKKYFDRLCIINHRLSQLFFHHFTIFFLLVRCIFFTKKKIKKFQLPILCVVLDRLVK